MSDKHFIEIDGSFGEGGGAILRLSAGYSILFNKPVKISNIRANRSKPGLRHQHLMGLKTLADLTGSKLSECEVGTKKISLIPNQEVQDNIQINVATAASVGLLIQPIQIACLGFNSPSKIKVFVDGGGTFGKWAPSINYLKNVTYKIFERCGFKITVDVQKHGFYPKGGAKTQFSLFPAKNALKPVNLIELGKIDAIEGRIVCTNHLKKPRVAERIKSSVKTHISRRLDMNTVIETRYVESLSAGVGLSLWARSKTGAIISTGTILGEKQLSSEKVGEIAAKKIIKYLQNEIPVDDYLSDQILPLMGLSDSSSKIKVLELTSHARTNLELIKKFTKRKYQVEKRDNHTIIEIV